METSEITCERLVLGRFSSRVEREHLARYQFAMQLAKDQCVGDIACGSGYGSQMLADAGAKSVHGVDISVEAISNSDVANRRPNVFYTVADAQSLTAFPDGAFDLVVSFETMEHVPQVNAYLDEMVRILRPCGMFLVSTPDRRIASVLHCILGHPQNPFHVREYTERELLNLLSTRFKIEACYGQEFVSQWLVFWPVQITIKTICRLLGPTKGSRLRDRLFGGNGNVEVTPRASGRRVPNFWVIACVRPEICTPGER